MNMINIMEKTHPNFISQIITMINHNGALTRYKGWMDDDDDDDKVDIYHNISSIYLTFPVK